MRDEEWNKQFAQQERMTLRGAIVLALALVVMFGLMALMGGV